MARSLNLYFHLSIRELERVVEDYQREFDEVLEDTFSDEELQKFESLIDSIAAIYVQPVSSEMSFEDFYPNPKEEGKQRAFFQGAKSSICIDNLPYFESNPFQVTYLTDLLWSFEEVLIDRGGVSELVFRKDFLEELKKYKGMDSLLKDPAPKVIEVKSSIPVTPIDFLMVDIYKELDRLKGVPIDTESLSEKAKKIYLVMKDERLDSSTLFVKSGLIPKDFDDSLERLKFWLKKIT